MTRCLVGLSSLLERARLGQDKVGRAKPLMVSEEGRGRGSQSRWSRTRDVNIGRMKARSTPVYHTNFPYTPG
jgi:hypothetical protein